MTKTKAQELMKKYIAPLAELIVISNIQNVIYDQVSEF